MAIAREACRYNISNNSSHHTHPPHTEAGSRPNGSRPKSVAIMGGSVTDSLIDSTDLNKQKPRLFDMRLLAESLDHSMSRQESVTLEEALQSLTTILEDYQGQFPELAKLEEMVHNIDRLIKVSPITLSAQGSHSSPQD